jgi:hypothetical protein
MMKWNVRAFALAFGIWWGVGIFLVTWWVIAFGGGSTGEPTFLGRIYLGYEISPLGSVIGLVWGFVDALIGGAIFAWLYNVIATRMFAGSQQQSQGSG